MKKFAILLICLIFSMCFLTACKIKKDVNTINYNRRLEQYIPSEKTNSRSAVSGVIDLSDGQKVRYDGKLGPSDVNFDFKIKSQY